MDGAIPPFLAWYLGSAMYGVAASAAVDMDVDGEWHGAREDRGRGLRVTRFG